jgi:hypothetical protein
MEDAAVVLRLLRLDALKIRRRPQRGHFGVSISVVGLTGSLVTTVPF